MGLAASQARLMMLISRKSDLEFLGQSINQERMMLAALTSQLFSASSNLDPDSREAAALQGRIERLQMVDKILELQLKRIDTQHNAVQTEIGAVDKVIEKNIASSFKTFA